MYTFHQEPLHKILDELKPLLEKHWEEVAWYQDTIKLNPDYDKYLTLEKADCLMVSTVRNEKELIGYNIHIIVPNLHYSDHLYAMNDIIFLAPAHRHAGLANELIDWSESLLEKKGVSVITYHMKLAHPFRSLMETTDYEPQEIIYSKRLGE